MPKSYDTHDIALRGRRRENNIDLGRRIEEHLRKQAPGRWVSRKDLAAVLGTSINSISLAVRDYCGVLDVSLIRPNRGDRCKGGFVRIKPALDNRLCHAGNRYRRMVDKLWSMGVRDIRPRRKSRGGEGES